MKKHHLRLDEGTSKLVCYAIKTHLTDFEIAFRINAVLGLSLERIPDHSIKISGDIEYSFSTFVYDDEQRMLQWHLISNRSHLTTLPQQNTSRPSLLENLETQSQIYLIPDQRTTNYWLLTDCDEVDIAHEVKKLGAIDAIESVTRTNIKVSKYWSNLLLY